MKIAAITPTRGDRPQFVEHCKYLMQAQTRRPDKHYVIDYAPLNNDCDLIPRIKKGIDLAKADGMDYIFIIEDDDYYSPNYIIEMAQYCNFRNLFIGSEITTYYHLTEKGVNIMYHNYRASLFTTTFHINALNSFNWPANDCPNLDYFIWEFAEDKQKTLYRLDPNIAIGIKHGIGKCGGNGHNPNIIPYTKWELSELITDKKSLEFYNNLTK